MATLSVYKEVYRATDNFGYGQRPGDGPPHGWCLWGATQGSKRPGIWADVICRAAPPAPGRPAVPHGQAVRGRREGAGGKRWRRGAGKGRFEFLSALALQLAKDAIAGGAKAIVGPDSSDIGAAIQNYVLDEAGVPLIVLGAVTSKLRTKHPLFILLSRSIPLQSLALAHWLKAHPIGSSAKPRWACIHSDYNYGVGVCDAFKRAYGEVGEEIGRVAVPLKTVKMKKEIVQLAKLKPDFTLAAFGGEDAQVFFKDYYRFKVHEKIPLISTSASVTPNLLEVYEKTLEQYDTGVGLIASDVYMATADTPVNQHFVTLVQQTYQTLPSYRHLWGYDTGRLLIKALVELNGKWDGAKVVQLMKTLPYTSPRQIQPLQFDTHGDVISGAYITKVKREGNRLVREIVAEVPPINLDVVLK